MSNSFNRVLSKMPKGKAKKAQLRSAKPLQVKLGKIDELDELVSQAYGNMEYALEQFYEGREKIILARDIIRFEEPSPRFLHDEIMALDDSLTDLGVEIPDELKEVSSNLTEVEIKHNELYDEMENLGINPMVDRL